MNAEDVPWLRLLHQEARAVLDASMKGIDDVNGRAAEVFKVTPLILAVLTAGLPLLFAEAIRKAGGAVPDFIVGALAFGLLLMLAATVLSFLAYGRKAIKAGLGDFGAILEGPLDEEEYLRRAITTYEEAIASNALLMERSADLLQFALYALVAGIGVVAFAAIRLLFLAGYP